MSDGRRRPRPQTMTAPAPTSAPPDPAPAAAQAQVEVEHHTVGQSVTWSRYRYPSTQRVVVDVTDGPEGGTVTLTYEVLASLLSEAGFTPQVNQT